MSLHDHEHLAWLLHREREGEVHRAVLERVLRGAAEGGARTGGRPLLARARARLGRSLVTIGRRLVGDGPAEADDGVPSGEAARPCPPGPRPRPAVE